MNDTWHAHNRQPVRGLEGKGEKIINPDQITLLEGANTYGMVTPKSKRSNRECKTAERKSKLKALMRDQVSGVKRWSSPTR